MKTKNLFILSIFLIFSISFVVAGQLSLNVRPVDSNNNPQPNTAFTYSFNFTNSSSCVSTTNVIWSNLSLAVTTNVFGDSNITLTTPSTIKSNNVPTHICYYRSDVLKGVLIIGDGFFSNIYATNLNISNNVQVSNNITSDEYGFFEWIGYTTNRITKGWFIDLDVKNNVNSSNITTFNVIVNGTNIDATYLNTNDFNVTNTSYSLNQTLTDMWSPFLNTTNLTYLMIDRWNATNESYLKDYGDTATGNYTFDTNTFFIGSDTNRVGIGTTSPGTALQVNGTINASKITVNNTAVMTIDQWNATNESYLKDYGDTATGNYTFDTSTFFIDSTNDRVGIGTTVPDQKLQVVGNSANISIVDNSLPSAVSSALYLGVPSVKTYAGLVMDYSNDKFYIRHNSGTRVTIDSSGNVGIGTTSPGTALQVNGTINASKITVNNTAVMTIDQWNATNTSYYLGSNPNTYWNTTFATFNKTYADTLYFGIGNWNATNASYALNQTLTDMWSPFLNTTNLTYLMIDRFNVTNTSYLLTANWNATNTTYREKYNLTWVGNFNATSNVTLGTNRLFVDDATGNVGIGTTGPGNNLHIKGALGPYYTGVTVESNAVAPIGYASMYVLKAIDGGTAYFALADPGYTDSYLTKDYYLGISTSSGYGIKINTNATNNNGMVILTNGNIGIRTITPNQTLDVFGTINAPKITVNNTAVMTIDQWNATNTSYYLASNPNTYWNTTFATFNKTYADTLYFGIGNWNATNASYALNQTLTDMWNPFLNTTNLTYLMIDRFNVTNTSYLMIDRWNATNESYLKDYGDTATGNYTFDTNTFFIDSTNDGVGIGTVSPAAKLHINTTDNTTTPFQVQGLNATGGIFTPFYIQNSTGYVGIGTTSPQNKLNIVGATNSTTGFIVGAFTGVTANYSVGSCWIAFSGGIAYGSNCTAF